jgi:hypothetical protein
MARVYKNFRAAMTTGGVTTYTCPANTKAIVLHCQVANIHATDSANASVHWTDDDNSDVATYWAKTVAVAMGTALSVVTGKPVLEAGDTIVGTASADSKLQLSGSVLEIS